jgi:arylsulfatase A-like enzyme
MQTCLLPALLLLLTVPTADAHSTSRPSVLLIFDDLDWRDLGCQGSSWYQTPQIDAFARTGLRLTQAYSACAVCSPSLAAVLTGRTPARLLLTDWLPSSRWNPAAKLREGRLVRGLPVEERTLAEVPRGAGYRTACIGKWHPGSEPFSLPDLTSTSAAMRMELPVVISSLGRATGKFPGPVKRPTGTCCRMADPANTSPIDSPMKP